MAKFSKTSQWITPRNAFVKLLRCAESVSADVHRFAAENGLTVSQFGILEALYHLGPLCQKNLADKILKSQGNITTVINNLEKRGLVYRKREDSDKRYSNIFLTSLGCQLIEELLPVHVEHIAMRMTALTKEEQKNLSRLCRKLLRQ